MDPTNTRYRLLLQIVVGSAWVDGKVGEAEVYYLKYLFRHYELTQDPELMALLENPVPVAQTEQWMVDYLMAATEEERMQLLSAIGNLLIADDDVSPEEHELLDDYHTLMANIPPREESAPKLVSTVGEFLRKVAQVVNLK